MSKHSPYELEGGLKQLRDRARPFQAFYGIRIDINRGEAAAVLAEIERLRTRLLQCETSLETFDDGMASEYWARYGGPPNRGEQL